MIYSSEKKKGDVLSRYSANSCLSVMDKARSTEKLSTSHRIERNIDVTPSVPIVNSPHKNTNDLDENDCCDENYCHEYDIITDINNNKNITTRTSTRSSACTEEVTIPERSMLVVNKLQLMEQQQLLDGNSASKETFPSLNNFYRNRGGGSLTDFHEFARYKSILKSPDSTNVTSKSAESIGSVSFGHIQIRRYYMAIGDNPACSFGAPVGLSWEYEEDAPMDVDLYECDRRPRRKLKYMILSYYRRLDILKAQGYSDAEVQEANQNRAKVQRQRGCTKILMPVSKVEEAFQSAARKMKRALHKDKPNP